MLFRSPATAPVPIPAQDMVKALAVTLPGSQAASSKDTFAEPGTYGVGKGWMTVPASLARTRVRLEEGVARLDGGDSPAVLCQEDATLLDGSQRVHAQLKVDGLSDPKNARISVRLLDSSDEPVGDPEGMVAATATAASQDWTFIDRAVEAPAGAAQARLCVTLDGPGTAWIKGASIGR